MVCLRCRGTLFCPDMDGDLCCVFCGSLAMYPEVTLRYADEDPVELPVPRLRGSRRLGVALRRAQAATGGRSRATTGRGPR